MDNNGIAARQNDQNASVVNSSADKKYSKAPKNAAGNPPQFLFLIRAIKVKRKWQ